MATAGLSPSKFSYHLWRLTALMFCLVSWGIVLGLRSFLGLALPWQVYFPLLIGMAGFVLVKLFFRTSGKDDRGTVIMIASSFLNFIILLSGQFYLLIASILTVCLGYTQVGVKWMANHREMIKTHQVLLYGMAVAGVLLAIAGYYFMGVGWPLIGALLAINVFAVAMYLVFHPTTYTHIDEISPMLVLMMDFFAANALFHSAYIPLSLFFPNIFTISLTWSMLFLFNGVMLSVMTPLVIDKPKNSAELEQVLPQAIPLCNLSEKEMPQPSAPPAPPKV